VKTVESFYYAHFSEESDMGVKGDGNCPLAGLKGGSPHLGTGAKRPVRVEGSSPAQ